MSEYKLADTYDSVSGLQKLNDMSPPLFYDYAGGIKTEWHDFVSRALSGDRKTFVPIGLPFVSWIFFKLSPAELAYLKATFGVEVTIRTLDKSTNSFKNFNATMQFPDISSMEYDIGDWYDFKIDFIDLVEIT